MERNATTATKRQYDHSIDDNCYSIHRVKYMLDAMQNLSRQDTRPGV